MTLEGLKTFVAEIFTRLGMSEAAAHLSAAALVAADAEGMPTHGVRLVPAYVQRMLAGSISTETDPKVVHDAGSAIVLDAAHMPGPLSADWAIPMVSERAREHGLACVAIRNGAHFGTAGFWARQIAEAGLIGIAMSNARPLKPHPALAIALPSAAPQPFIVDLQANRMAADPAAALARMLLPSGAANDVGLAAAVDLVCGGLAGGAVGAQVGALDGDPATPCNGSQLFVAIDPARFGVADLAGRVAGAPRDMPASGRRNRDDELVVPPELVAKLNECAAKVGVERTLE
jgi:LDH2 family malate/lactate/ureidoglycolate dehydrogenase